NRPPRKLAQIVDLRSVAFRDARIIYDDGSPPIEWRNLDVIITHARGDDFSCDISGGDRRAGAVLASAKIQLDQPGIQLDRCQITLRLDEPEGASCLPAFIASRLR